MDPTKLIDEARTPAGEIMKLTSRSGYFSVSIGRDLLMSSAEHHSEERMAELAIGDAVAWPETRVLIGGLGMGFTLRAALDRLGPDGRAHVVELMPAVVEWNRGPLAHLAEHPLDDTRASIEVVDLVDFLAARPEPFDGILLDVDNGPEAFTAQSNSRLYSRNGLRRLLAALKPGGALVVWSAFDSPPFVRKLQQAGFSARAVRARGRGKKGARHTLFVAKRT
jgi:spermidine synthase